MHGERDRGDSAPDLDDHPAQLDDTEAGTVVLEPVSLLTVRVPAAYQGDVMGDINARRGRVQGTGSSDGESEVTALVPTAEILRYAIDLRSMTGGRGSFVAIHDHYDVLPKHLEDKVRERARDQQVTKRSA